MKKVENYRPAKIEFTAESPEVPKFLNEGKAFKDAAEAHRFMNENFVASSSKFTAQRLMDDYEIDQLRHQYQEELEDNLPKLKKDLREAERILEDAKANKKAAEEAVNASLNKVQQLSVESKEGTTEMNLDQAFTYEVVYSGKRYYYTIMDKKIQLAGIREIAMYEADDLISSSERNAQAFAEMKDVIGG